jgi:glycosyltransferase involved in cell wall biosynthesis
MRVLHVDTAAEWRGGQQQLAYLLESRPEDFWAGVPNSPLSQKLDRPPDLSLWPGNNPFNAVLLRFSSLKVDLIAAHTPHAHGLALFAAKPLVVHRRTDFAPRHPFKYNQANRIIAVSQGVARILQAAGVEAAKIRVVHDGVAPKIGKKLKNTPSPLYLAVGALVGHKGHSSLVHAMVEVPGTLWIAGEGELRGALEQQIQSLKLEGRVRLLGQRNEIGELLASADVFVHPSLEEGMGQVVAEAMGAGCRVVATAAGGIPEVLGETGILVPPGKPAALVEALKRGLRLPMRAGVERALRFSVEAMVSGTEAVYAELIEQTVE